MFVDFNILNQLGSPSINSNTFANRPSAGQVGRLFVSTDTFEIYRDNGTGWDLIGGPGSSTVTGSGAAGQVTYWTGTNSVGGENNLWWDAANNRFGVNTNTPTAAAEVVQTDGVALYSNFTTNAGSGPGTTAILAKNTTNSSGYAAVIEERTPNVSAGQYPVLIRHTLSSGTAAANMATGIHFGLPDDAGTERINQFSMDTVDAAAATYSSRYRFLLRNNGSAVTPFYITGTGLGVFTATPGAALDIHSTGIIAQFNTTSGTGNTYIAFQRTGTGIWRIGDTYNGGNNFFELHNTVLGVDAMEFQASTNKSTFQAQENYTTGLARGNYFDYNLSVAAGGSFSSPNAITSLGASLDLSLAGNATIPSGARSGLDAYNSIAFTGTGTLTQNQGSQLRTYANLTTGWAFNGSATGTITHLSGIHVRFPDNSGSAIAITNNYGLLINDQTANTGTVTYTNRWGIYQEGASDLNYMAANLLLGSTTNSGEKLQVTGTAKISGAVTVNGSNITIDPSTSTTYSLFIAQNTGGYTRIGRDTSTGALYGEPYASLLVSNGAYPLIIGTNDTERMRITSGGLVGIKTTAPSGLLQLNGVLATPGDAANITIKQSGTTYTDGIYLERGGERKGYYMYLSGTDDSLTFRRNNSGTLGDVMYLTRDGKVGINGISSTQLSVIGGGLSGGTVDSNITQFLIDNNSDAGIQILTPNNNIGRLIFGTTADRDGGLIRWDYTNKNFDFSTDTSGGYIRFLTGTFSERAQITSGGNFLIGTTTDAGQKLQVSGNINVYNSINGGILTSASGKTFIASSGETELYLRHTVVSGVTTAIANFANVTTGDPMIFYGQVRADGTNTLVQLGDITAYGNGTLFSVNDASSTIITSSSNIDFNGLTSSVSAGSLVGYITIKLNGISYKMPYYNL